MSDSTTAAPRNRSTLQDVARRAGVSASTVSSVLAGNAGPRRISDETYRKVRLVATELGYTPNLLHRSMRRGRTHVLSFYSAFRNHNRGDLYLNRLSEEIEIAGGDLGYDILVHSNFKRDVRETYEFLNGGFADGLILFGPTAGEPLLPLLRASSLPTVLVGPRYEEPELSVVADDEAAGIALLADALTEAGHRDVAAVGERVDGVLDPTGRLARLGAEMAARGGRVAPENVVVWNGSADEAAERLLALPRRPSALFVWHDRIAYDLLVALEARGLRVPRDLSIVGYDGLVWPSPSAHVVTSVRVPLDAMAASAVRLLDRMIGGELGPLATEISVSLHPGTTLGPPSLP